MFRLFFMKQEKKLPGLPQLLTTLKDLVTISGHILLPIVWQKQLA
jgi:hypothetical protein